jgi:hypothetical protein
MAGYVAVLLGVHNARPGGDRRVARIFTALVAAAWVAFLVSMAVEAVTGVDPSADVLGPIAGLAQGIGLVGTGVMTVTARRWSGWRRYAPLGLAVVYVGVVFLPAGAGSEPSALTETVWALGYGVLGLALLTEQGWAPSRGQAVLGAVVAVAAIASAALVTSSVSTASDSVVTDHGSGSAHGEGAAGLQHRAPATGFIDGSANNLEHRAPATGFIDGSANNLEHRAGSH